MLNQTFKIPAGADSYDVKASLTIPLFLDSHAIWIYPHMHLLGRQIKVDVLNRDKTITPFIYENDWNFNWQGSYTFKEAIPVTAGSTVHPQLQKDWDTTVQANPSLLDEKVCPPAPTNVTAPASGAAGAAGAVTTAPTAPGTAATGAATITPALLRPRPR